jgi:phosphoenolpyruvate-protein phosphotransferase (PTS system enzyme I)
MFKGIGASPGIAVGKVLIVENNEFNIEQQMISDVEAEVERLSAAVEKSRNELEAVKEKALLEMGEEKAKVFESYLMVLEDPEFIDSTIAKIREENINAEYAFAKIRDMFINLFESMDDDYMKERAADVKDVANRILRHLLGSSYVDLSVLPEEVILVAHDLTPSDTALMDKQKVLGFLTDIGGRTSHTAIMARTLEIPAVVGLKDITSSVKNGDYIALNGTSGEVVVNPDSETLEKFNKLKADYEYHRKELLSFAGKETVTLDGRKVELAGNIGSVNDIEGLLSNDAEGVGLYRTEFLYMEGTAAPSEEDQFEAYKSVLEALNSKPVVIRTLDIGGDKKLPYLNIEPEMNPFLGYRAIRLCLDRKDIFKTQLRALLRASIYGNLKIMFPMISNLQELLQAKTVLEEVKKELSGENISFSNDIEIGMMIEVPSAAIISDVLAKHVDFFSIGTNDLIQYTCAVDRMNEKITHLYNQFNPSVLRLIKLVIDNAHKAGKWVGMCGEAAGDLRMIPVLLGMGLDEFSMGPIAILEARKLINSLKYEDAKRIAEEVLKLETDEEIEAYIETNIVNM